MQELCHRCHGELPPLAAGNRQSSDDAMLFCPRCSAPQIMLPEHMRSELALSAGGQTTGATPPPRPPHNLPNSDARPIDWRVALPIAGAIALVAAALRLVSFRFDPISLVWLFWLLAGGNLALAVYARKRPAARMDARVGLRIGLVTGMLMCGATAIVTGATGMIARYGMHGMTSFDQQNAEQSAVMQAQIQAWLDQNSDADTQKNFTAMMNSPRMKSPEMLAGNGLFGYGFVGLLLTLLAGAVGAINGKMRGIRLSRPQRDQ